jgi:hypothetical protein
VSKNRYVNTGFWSDQWVADDLDKLERYFFLYLITNERTSIAGVYQSAIKTIANETDFSKEEVLELFQKMSNKVRYIDGWVVLRKGIKNQNYHNSKVKTGIDAVLMQCPPEALDYIDFPQDFGAIPERKQLQLVDNSNKPVDNLNNRGQDESYMTLGDQSHLIKSNLIKLNSNPDAAPPVDNSKPVGDDGLQESNKFDRKNYAKAVRADEALAEKERNARLRKPLHGKNTKSLSEVFRQRKAKK